MDEVVLVGGDVTPGVVRVGATVRRPTGPHTAAVHALLRHLEAVGFDGAPRVLGTDEHGREVLTYVEGDVAHRPYPPWVAEAATLASVAVLLRRSHEALASFVPPVDARWDADAAAMPPGPAELVAHADATPENVVFRDGAAVALVDWDLARPVSRLFDLATLLRHWAPLAAPADRDPVFATVDVPARVRLAADAYGLDADQRSRLVGVAQARLERSYDAMRRRAHTHGGGWARMWAEGVGDRIRRAQQWLEESAPALEAALR